jgi:hypothetical protein
MSAIQIPVSIGEAVDKITILNIKKEKISSSAAKINEEISLITQAIKDFNVNVKYFIDLELINRELWDIEDNIRVKEKNNQFFLSYQLLLCLVLWGLFGCVLAIL